LVANRTAAALAQLERARELDPGNPSVYALLAKAYQRQGNSERAQEALTRLTELNAAQAEKIGSAPGDRKASYAGSRAEESPGRR
jgi:Flp pilus assembly protein TadD